MIGVGIGFILNGLVPIIVTKKLKGEMKEEVVKIHRGFMGCGVAILFLYSIGYFFDKTYQIIISALPVMVFALYMLSYINKLLKQGNV
ncbi:hypothetical protein ABC382_00175 [Lysinibacillus sp. 1P01SD]|uniref:hypothetical protein n=1 Tax=Lysinibacillus sp. 1P01SD TaxID=3132285 RepID=UPI0039A33F24